MGQSGWTRSLKAGVLPGVMPSPIPHYYPPKMWKLFNTWCAESSFNIHSTVAKLEFLHSGADKGLALSTLKGQVSALSVFLEKQLAVNPWIARFFKAQAGRDQ